MGRGQSPCRLYECQGQTVAFPIWRLPSGARCRSSSFTCTTMSILSPLPIIAPTCVDLQTFHEGGESERRHLSIGAGWPDSYALFLSLSIISPHLTIRCRHRVFAELLEQGTRSTLVIPTHRPQPSQPASASQAGSVGLQPEAGGVINPSHALQHPGYYYYMAARCTETRRERFLQALENQVPIFSSHQVFYLMLL